LAGHRWLRVVEQAPFTFAGDCICHWPFNSSFLIIQEVFSEQAVTRISINTDREKEYLLVKYFMRFNIKLQH
jgi:hypothetical protein